MSKKIDDDELDRQMMNWALRDLCAKVWSAGHEAGRDYAGDGWNSDTHDPELDNPYRQASDGEE